MGEGYWWIRNSWGAGWGLNGYMKLHYGSNTCNIASHATDVGVGDLAGTACTVQCSGGGYCGCPCGPKYNKCTAGATQFMSKSQESCSMSGDVEQNGNAS